MKYLRRSYSALKYLTEKTTTGSNINNFALVYPKGDILYSNYKLDERKDNTLYFLDKVCYMNVCYAPAGAVSMVSVVRPFRDGDYEEDIDAPVSFLHWVLNDSPFSKVFYTKDAKEGLKKGIVCYTNVYSSLLIGGLSAVREINENVERVLFWKELIDMGMSPTYAYIAIHFICMLGETKWILNDTIGTVNTQHLPLSSPLSKKYIKNFCNGRVRDTVILNRFNENTSYSGINNLWGSREDRGQKYSFKYSIKPTKIKYEWGNYDTGIVFETKKEKQTFIKEFSEQMKRICND